MKKGNGIRALSLIEIVLAIAILILALIPCSSLFSQGISALRDIRDRTVIINIAEQQIHRYIHDINNLDPGIPMSFIDRDITQDIVEEYNDKLAYIKNLKIVATVQPSSICVNGAHEIKIAVQWKSGTRSAKFTLFNIKARRENM